MTELENSDVVEFLSNKPDEYLNKVYSSSASCLSIFRCEFCHICAVLSSGCRIIAPLAQQVVLRLLYIQDRVPASLFNTIIKDTAER